MARYPQRSAARSALRRSRGFIVLAVLWIVAALSGLVLIYLNFVTTTAIAVGGAGDRVQSEALLTAAVELSALQLTEAKGEAPRPTSGVFGASVGAAKIAVTFRSEASRVDLNAAPKPLLAGLFTGIGVPPADADAYADRIVAWRAPVKPSDDDPETSFYRNSGLTYAPRHGPFPAVEELWLVHGIPPPLIERVLPLVTVYGNGAAVNVMDAPPQVIAALPGMTPERLQAILTQRSDPRADPRTVQTLAGTAGGTAAATLAYRLGIEATLDNGRRSAAEVVILILEDADQPYRVLSWRNRFDGDAAQQEVTAR